jgi:hypothetical protein
MLSKRVTHAALIGLLSLLPMAGISAVSNEAASSSPEVAAAAAPAPAEEEGKPQRPKLRAGITENQLSHAVTIVETGQEMDLPRQAYVVAIATALQESRMSVLANVNVPHSFDYQPRDGYGRDHDSVGIFQQRVSYYCVNDLKFCMDPRYSAIKFYGDLKKVDGWESLPVTVAAQRVQNSAFPDHYAKHQGAAELIVDSILEWQDA